MLIDVTRLLDRALRGLRPTGVDRVGLAYVGHFREQSQALVRFAGRWLFFPAQQSQRLFDWLLEPDTAAATRIRRLVGIHAALGWGMPSQNCVLLNVTHSGLDKADYGNRVRRYGLYPFYFLHDAIPIAFPEYARPGEAEKHRRRLKTMLDTGSGLIVNSAQTGQELEAFARVMGVAVPPWAVAHLATPDFSPPSKKRPLESSYFVVLGTIEPRKNHLLLLNLWRRLARELGRNVPKLVVIGRRGWECEQVVDMLERCDVLKEVIVEIPNCDDASLATWMHYAQALLFPSFAEGYGIPLVEALSLGTPVIVSDLPVFRELAGDVPEYLDPVDGLGWRSAILDYSVDQSPRRAAQIRRMTGWRAPTWSAHFEQVENLMAQVLV